MDVFVDAEDDYMAFTPEQIRRELEETERRLEDAAKKRKDAETVEKRIEAERDAYRVLLGDTATARVAVSGNNSGPENDGETTNKTDAIRAIIRDAGTAGASAIDIWRNVQRSGPEMHRNYIYAVLNRLSGSGA